MSELNPIINLVEQGIELAEAFKEATDDGKIRLFEWVKLIGEASDVVKVVRDVKADSISELKEGEIQILSTLVMNSIDREVKFMREDVVNTLRIAQNASEMIMRVR